MKDLLMFAPNLTQTDTVTPETISMFAARLISDNVPPLKPGDTCGRALTWMDELRVNALPVIKGREYLGLIYKSGLNHPQLANKTIEEADIRYHKVFVYENQHVYDLTKVASLHKLDLVPVLNNEQEYIGLVTVNDLVSYFAESKSVYTPGGIIILELALNDYSMSHIAQVIESDGAHILSSSISATPDPARVELTLKIDKVDLTRILSAFYRLDYHVIASYHQSEHSEDLKNRYESLMNYLNI
ncbi:MAG: cbs domain containing protein [Bacteroidia bacterium]|nr:cbs domain containing protein [Bacteroidia bacterium]